MSNFSLYLSVAFLNEQRIINDMGKLNIKSEKITPFGGILM